MVESDAVGLVYFIYFAIRANHSKIPRLKVQCWAQTDGMFSQQCPLSS